MPLNCNLPEAGAVKPFTDKPVICSGRMQPDAAADAIREGKIDFLGIGRQHLVEEDYVTKLREEKKKISGLVFLAILDVCRLVCGKINVPLDNWEIVRSIHMPDMKRSTIRFQCRL